MDQDKKLSEIMATPERDECEARFVELAATLEREGYRNRDICRACLLAALDVSQNDDDWTEHLGFLKMARNAIDMCQRLLGNMAGRLSTIRANAN